MSRLSLIVVLFCSSTLFAEDKANSGVAQPVVTQGNSAQPAKNEKVTANKPVIEEKKAEVKAEPALHEHPTLVAMLQKNNEYRGQVGLAPHRMSPALVMAAQDHANYMAATGSFSHYSNGGPSGRAARYGYGTGIMENIAMGQDSVESVFNTWRNSGGHWANITSGTTEAGFGYQIGAGGTYWVAVYGNGGGVVISSGTVVSGEVIVREEIIKETIVSEPSK